MTGEFSFKLGVTNHGIGVFATHSIRKGEILRLLGPEGMDFRSRKLEDVPEIFRGYCLHYQGGKLITPIDFGMMSVEWYLNHADAPHANITTVDGRTHIAAREIEAGEEVTIDYRLFEESNEGRGDYYLN